jgi:hypothetical protein
MIVFLVVQANAIGGASIDSAFSRRRDAELRAEHLGWRPESVVPVSVDARLDQVSLGLR